MVSHGYAPYFRSAIYLIITTRTNLTHINFIKICLIIWSNINLRAGGCQGKFLFFQIPQYLPAQIKRPPNKGVFIFGGDGGIPTERRYIPASARFQACRLLYYTPTTPEDYLESSDVDGGGVG